MQVPYKANKSQKHNRMKVAILAPIVWRTPPQKYGPWEQVASNVAEGLLKLNIDVTLYATANSKTSGKLKYISETAYGEDKSKDPKVWEALHIAHLMENANNYDIIHNHFDFLPLTYSKLIKTPILTTIHGFSSKNILPVYKKYNNSNHYVSISNSDRNPLLKYIRTVYNGINPKYFTFVPKHGEYLLFFGRIHPDKGTYEAIQIAKKANKKLIISGIIQNENYFNTKVKPYIDKEQIIYVGNSGPKQRDKLLGGALTLLHPINFDEPFGLSVAEAMFCGTPVVAFGRGSMFELIKNKKTGFIVNNIGEAANAVNLIHTINRIDCYNWAMQNFSKKQMTKNYLKLYKKVIKKNLNAYANEI